MKSSSSKMARNSGIVDLRSKLVEDTLKSTEG